MKSKIKSVPIITNSERMTRLLDATGRASRMLGAVHQKWSELRMMLRGSQFIMIDMLTDDQKRRIDEAIAVCNEVDSMISEVQSEMHAKMTKHAQEGTEGEADVEALRFDILTQRVRKRIARRSRKKPTTTTTTTKKKT